MKSIEVNKYGQNIYLSRDKESLIGTKAYIQDSHSVGVARYQFGNRLRSITKQIDPQKANKTLKQDSISVYAKNFTRSVNKGEDKGKNQEIVSRRGKVRVYNDMDKKIYPRLNWVF